MPRLCRRLAERGDGDDDPEPSVGARGVALRPYLTPDQYFADATCSILREARVRGKAAADAPPPTRPGGMIAPALVAAVSPVLFKHWSDSVERTLQETLAFFVGREMQLR